ncbi:MAG: DUF1080 domain-containing protein [Bryobacteraceae bacterium]|nr:DUF1080 domain-containing protein [Bryobacteraceae bacterium]MDW8378026.1 DUF1080 domain-containing protein [Bryobacterales bacterium]
MNRRHFLALASLVRPVTPAAAAIEEGFLPLFDGKTLEGWKVCDGPESAFHVVDGAIAVHPSANYPTWLRSLRKYENFDFRGEFFLKGWMDSGIYLHAPEHGRNTWCGLEIKLFHQQEAKPTPYSCGAIFPILAPSQVTVKNKGEWNSFRILCDWPKLEVWINETQVQNLDMEAEPALRYRLRNGYLGFQSLSYPIRFRNLRIKELPGKEKWQPLYETPSDLASWRVSEGKPVFEAVGHILRLEGVGHLATQAKYRDFALHAYIRTSRAHNGGVIFRSSGGGTRAARHYEIQLHNVEGARFPTGSLYHYKRAAYPRITDEKWWLFQLFVKGPSVVVRINGENVLEFDQLEDLDEGFIELQAHQAGSWAEFKHLWVKPL